MKRNLTKLKKVLDQIKAAPMIPPDKQKIITEVTIKAREYEQGNATFDVYQDGKPITAAVSLKIAKRIADIRLLKNLKGKYQYKE